MAVLSNASPRYADALHYCLTPYQLRLCGLIATGLSDREIAEQLGRGLYTIQKTVHKILKSTAARSRTEIAVRYVRSVETIEMEEYRLG